MQKMESRLFNPAKTPIMSVEASVADAIHVFTRLVEADIVGVVLTEYLKLKKSTVAFGVEKFSKWDSEDAMKYFRDHPMVPIQNATEIIRFAVTCEKESMRNLFEEYKGYKPQRYGPLYRFFSE